MTVALDFKLDFRTTYEDVLVAMKSNAIKSSFLRLPREREVYVLASLAHQITICVRAAFAKELERETLNEALRALNEIEHTITGQLTHLLANDNKWYVRDEFVDIVFDKARQAGLERDLIWAFEFALGPVLTRTSSS
jgi:hypothetical protein